ncbi:hypothetical protein D5F01_LYC03514 [Larimichthys crocea]|uniref:Uncharacterized protein n=1 Tax=Larimichthys crocea TaxID=215358 RepID=A0A6G0J097_LARCR|nr:hypothetical protein D5F01_LYC03514 [Larimichthys crocea]
MKVIWTENRRGLRTEVLEGLGTHDSGGEDDQDQTTTEGLGTHDSSGEDDQDQTTTEGLGTHDSSGEDDQDQTTTEGLGTHDSSGEDDQDQTTTEGLGTHDSSGEDDEQGNIQSSPQTRDQGQTRTEGEENYTKDNKTQGIMEKCQWDLKRIRFHHKRLTRFDDFFHTYKKVHQALLREHKDSLKIKKKVQTKKMSNKIKVEEKDTDTDATLFKQDTQPQVIV